MPYETYMGTYIDENDHNLERKFGYKYRALKGIYPDAYKLPETEVSKAIDVFYEGDANEDVTTMTDRVRNYTTAKDQEWKAKYFGEASKPKPQESYSSTTIKAPSGFAQSGGNEKKVRLQPYPDDDKYPKYNETEFLPNGDINFIAVYDRVKKEHPNLSQEAYDIKWNTPIYEQIKYTPNLAFNFFDLKNNRDHDKYKHAYINCDLAQNGFLNQFVVNQTSKAKELWDINKSNNQNLLFQSNQDMGANNIGYYLGEHYPNEDCHDLLRPYISTEYPYKY